MEEMGKYIGAGLACLASTLLGVATTPLLLADVPWDVLVILVTLGLLSQLFAASRLFDRLAVAATRLSGAEPFRVLLVFSIAMYVVSGVVNNLTALVLVLWIRKKRRRRVRTLIGTLVVSTPEPRRLDMTTARALERLLQIEKSGVLDRDEDRKRGYAEMVDVIREYTGARYRVATLDLTTAELVRSLAGVVEGSARARGVELGAATAREILARREGDGWNEEAKYAWQPMGPGVYAEFDGHSGTPKGFVFGAQG